MEEYLQSIADQIVDIRIFAACDYSFLTAYVDEVAVMEFTLWHGTNQEFDHFDETMLGLNTYNDASKAAFFFAAHPDTAREYARFASRNLIPNQVEHDLKVETLLDKAERANHSGDLDGYERYVLEAEELEARAQQAEPWGGVILKCRIKVDLLTEVCGSDREVLINFGGILTDAKTQGYDALILRDILDTPSGEGPVDSHLAVYNTHCIEIIDRFDSEDNIPYDPHAIPRDVLRLQEPFNRVEIPEMNVEFAL